MTDRESSSRRAVMDALRARGYRPQSRLGQNFLFDPQLLRAFLDDAEVEEGELILEVGAGAGTLTAQLLDRGCEVIAVEVDPILCEFLRERLPNPRLTLIGADALARKGEIGPELAEALRAKGRPYRLVANLPYAIATPLLESLLRREPRLLGVGVLVQREVAERWIAAPGGRDYSAISVVLSLYGRGRISRKVAASLFSPPPKVESAFFVWEGDGPRSDEYRAVLAVARRLFLHRRKMLRAQLKAVLPPKDPWWVRHGLDPTWRPEQVPPEGFRQLTAELARREGPAQGTPIPEVEP